MKNDRKWLVRYDSKYRDTKTIIARTPKGAAIKYAYDNEWINDREIEPNILVYDSKAKRFIRFYIETVKKVKVYQIEKSVEKINYG